MIHIATHYTYREGHGLPNLIRYFWDQSSLSLLQQKEYLINGIHCPEEVVEMHLHAQVLCVEEALEMIAGSIQKGFHYLDNGTRVLVY